MRRETLEAGLLGNIRLIYEGENLVEKFGKSSKTLFLFLYMLYNPRGGTRDQLLGAVYGGEDVNDASNCLHGTLHRLRKYLKEFIPGLSIAFEGGAYRLDGGVEISVDARRFESLAAGAGNSLAALREAVGIYRGELLPPFSDCEWVVSESGALRRKYLGCVQRLCVLLSNGGLWEEAFSASARSLSIYPYEEALYLLRIRLLIQNRRYAEAVNTYNRAVRVFWEDLGAAISEDMKKEYRRMCAGVVNPVKTLREIKRELEGQEPLAGASCFDYPAFTREYQLEACRIERVGGYASLLLCVLTDTGGKPLGEGKARESARLLTHCIQQITRRSDVYTRYSQTQYLLFLSGVNQKEGLLVGKRLDALFRSKWRGRDVRLSFEAVSV